MARFLRAAKSAISISFSKANVLPRIARIVASREDDNGEVSPSRRAWLPTPGRKHEDGHLNIETSSVPNFVRAPNQRRIVTSITDEEMKLTNPRAPAGVTLELVFKRAK